MYLDEREKKKRRGERERERKRDKERREGGKREGRSGGKREREGVVARRISGTLRFPLLSSRTRWNDGAGIRGHFSSVRYLFGGGQGEKRAKRGSFLRKNRFRGDCGTVENGGRIDLGHLWDGRSFKSEGKMIVDTGID